MPLLELENLSLTFGGLKALCDFNFTLDQGQLVGLIGPNGAGKTTAFNIVTGVYCPTSGQIRFANRDIAGLKPFRISRLGIARTFQNVRLFGGLTVLDNVLIGFNQSIAHGFLGTILRTPAHQRDDAIHEQEAIALLRTLKLDARLDMLARNLPYGTPPPL